MADKEKPAKAAAGEPRRPRRRAQGAHAAKGGKSDKQGKDKKGAAPKAAQRRLPLPRPKDYKPRMKSHYEKVVREAMTKKFGIQEPDAGAAAREDRAQHGRRRSGERPQEGRQRRGRPGADRRTAAGADAVAQGDRHLQAARGHADRRQGDAARRPHVRVPRPPGDDRAAAREGLPRAEPQELRRSRQLCRAA